MSGGAGTFVKLDRALLDWEWFGDSNTVHVLIYLLLEVNWQPGKWQGIDIEPGSKVTSRAKIAGATGLSEKQVRLALERLEKSNVITRSGAGLGQLVTLVNWAKYQLNGEGEGRTRAGEKAGQGPGKGTPEGREKATIKEEKKLRREEGKNSSQLPLSGITEKAPKAEYGDRRINELMEFLKAENGGMIDQSIKANRQACWNLIRKAEGVRPDLDAVVGIKALITRGKLVPFHGPKITSFVYLLAHVTEIKNHIQQPNGKANTIDAKRAALDQLFAEEHAASNGATGHEHS